MSRDGDDRVPVWRRYLRFWRGDATGDVNDELSFHLESTIEELVAAGMTRDDAREAARRKFGDVAGIQRTLYTLSRQRERDMARTEWLDALTQDLVFGLRQLRKSPAFTTVAVLTLALGIGANSAIFSVVHSVLLRPLPYAHAERILTLSERNGQGSMCCLPFGNFYKWQQGARGFEALGATWGTRPWTMTGQGDPTPIATVLATAGYWKAMFIPPVLGRYYSDAEDREGATPVAVISYALWQTRFNADSNVIGKVIVLEGRPTTIIGVAPSAYILAPPAERIWAPLAPPAWRFNDFGDHELSVYGLLEPNAAPRTAVRQLEQIEMPLAREHPNMGYDGGVIATPLVDSVVGDQRTRLYLLLGAVSLVLLIACVNIANLLLARAAARRGEVAIRGALGATRGRLVVQMLVESLLLGVAGAVVGLGVAFIGVRFLVTAPAQIPRLQDTSLDGTVIGFTLLLALVCAVVFGLVPAIRAARLDLQQTLRDGGRESRGVARERLRQGLVIGELCVAQMLLIGAGLLIRSSIALEAVPIGFDTHNLLAVPVSLPQSRYKDPARAENTFQQMEAAIAAIPGVASVGRTQAAPIYSGGWDWTALREGSNGHDDGSTDSDMRFVNPSYFSTLGLRLLRGRAFTVADGPDALKVAIVSKGLALRLYGTADAVGRRISNSGAEHPQWMEIVGVVDDMRANGQKHEAPRELYMPTTQRLNGGYTFLVRGKVPVASLTPAIRRAVASVDPLVAPAGVSTMDEALDRTLAMDRFTKWLLTLLGGTGLLLAVIGVYGVIAYFVTQRTHELGVRLALGASGRSLQWLVVRQGFVLGVVGVAIGGFLSFAAARLLKTLVFGITPHDPVTFAAVCGILTAVAAAASWVPARRATRIDPLEALRSS